MKERENLRDLSIHGSKILKWILRNRLEDTDWIRVAKDGIQWWTTVNMVMQEQGISWLLELAWASEQILCCIESVRQYVQYVNWYSYDKFRKTHRSIFSMMRWSEREERNSSEKKSNQFKISLKLSPTDKCVEKSDAREWLSVWWEQAVGRRKNNVSPLLYPPPHLTG